MTAKDNTPEPVALTEANFDGDLPALHPVFKSEAEEEWAENSWLEQVRVNKRLESAAIILAQIAGHFPNGADRQAVNKALDLADLLCKEHLARAKTEYDAWLAANPKPEPAND